MIDFSKPVTWTEGETHHVGRVAIARYSPKLLGQVWDEWGVAEPRTTILIRHHHTDELEFVAEGKLQNYPTSPIPEPTSHEQAEPGRSEA